MTLAAGAAVVASISVAGGAPHASAHARQSGWQRVSYLGYAFQVPVKWPVINLATSPTACVRFDRHAIYLGQPGVVQSCPSSLVGTTEAVLVQPASTQPTTQPGGAVEDPVARRITVNTGRIVVTAAYHHARGQVLDILSSAGLPKPAVQDTARMAAQSQAVPAVPSSATSDTGKGFDACTAPASQAMSAWLANSSFTSIGIYIGGSDRACAQPALTAAWVQQEAAAGWHFFPLYVGPQVSFGEVSTHSAAGQAVAAAQDAVAQAKALGFGSGTPLYYDMESYAPKQRQAALTFFSSWTTELHALGYRSAIYSSSSSGITDLANNYNSAYAMPDVIDDAWWNGVANTADPNVPASAWANHQRIHQYSGNVNQTHGGYTINIDQDYMDVQLGAGSGGGGGGGGTANTMPARQASQAVTLTGSVVDAFYQASDKKLVVVRYTPQHGWSAPVSLGDLSSSQPSAVTASKGVAEVFYRGPGGALYAVKSSGSGWTKPRSLSMGRMGSAPLAVSTSDGGMAVFWRGRTASQLWSARYVPGAGWRGPTHVSGGLASMPSPAAAGASSVNVFWKGSDGRLWHTSAATGQAWRAPSAMAVGKIGTGPRATGQKNGEIDVLWGGTGRGSIWHTSYTKGRWSAQSMLAVGRHSVPALVTSSPGIASAFWKGQDDGLWNATGHGGTSWAPAAGLSMGKIGSEVFAAGRSGGTIDVFWKGAGNPHLWHARYHPTGSHWSGPDNLGGNVR